MKAIVRIILAALAYVVGIVLTGMIAPVLHLSGFRVPAGMDEQRAFLYLVVSVPLLTAGLTPLALGLRGTYVKRFLAIAALPFLALGLNGAIEAKIFSDLVPGNVLSASMFSLLPCLLAAAVLAAGGHGRIEPATMPHHPIGGWTWRLVAAWLAFPACYWFFGMMVGPSVMPYYSASTILHIPPPLVILETQLIRSVVFFAASLPAILLWRKSRGQFILAMGMAHAFAVGIFPLASANLLPGFLRVVHSVEITADSFAYAAILGLLFMPKPASAGQTVIPASHKVAV